MKESPSPKMEALEALAKAMSKLKLDKLKGYKKTNAKDPLADLPIDEESEEETPVIEGEEEEEDEDKPKGFSQVLEAIAKKHSKKH